MKRTIVVALVAGFIALFNGWIATNISPAFRIPEKIAEDVADKVDTISDTSGSDSWVSVAEKVSVTRVIDGDTVEVVLGNGEIALVRYIGIDTPERATDTTKQECFYNEATTKNKELVEGKEVLLKRDVSDKDKYGRLLRYVYVDEDLVNKHLVALGMAEVIRIEPDVTNYEILKQAETEAKKQDLGIWSFCEKE